MAAVVYRRQAAGCAGAGDAPGEVRLDVPEEVESQFARFLLPGDMLAVLGLPQLVCEGHCQVVLADVLLHLSPTTCACQYVA